MRKSELDAYHQVAAVVVALAMAVDFGSVHVVDSDFDNPLVCHLAWARHEMDDL